MEINKKSLGEFPLLEVKDEVDHFTAEEFQRTALESMDGRNRLVLDLTECRYMDSGGIAVILSLTRDLGSDGWLVVVGARRNISRLFQLVGLADEPGFYQFPDLATARETLLALAG